MPEIGPTPLIKLRANKRTKNIIKEEIIGLIIWDFFNEILISFLIAK